MSIDRSLVISTGMSRSRNVLTRGERIEAMQKKGSWKQESSVFGLPKMRAGFKMKKAKATDEKKAAAEPAKK